MSKLLFTSSKTSHSIGYIGGGADHIPLELWPKVPNSDAYQTHLFTLYSDFLPENVFPRRNYYISVFISIEEHALGGVKDSISSKYTVNCQDDLILLNDGFSCAVLYEREQDIGKQDLGSISLERKFFERLDEVDKEADAKYNENEHLFFEDNGMGLDVSKIFGNPYFEQDKIYPSPKFNFCLQLLEEDIDKKLHIFQNGIGYFYYDQNVKKKLLSGNQAGIFFIQNT